MLARMWRKKNTPPLLVGLKAGTTTLESIWCFLRELDIVLPKDPAIPLLGIYPEDFPTYNRYMLHYVHSNLIYNSQKLTRTEMSNRGMDTKNVVHLHNRVTQLLKTMNS